MNPIPGVCVRHGAQFRASAHESKRNLVRSQNGPEFCDPGWEGRVAQEVGLGSQAQLGQEGVAALWCPCQGLLAKRSPHVFISLSLSDGPGREPEG